MHRWGDEWFKKYGGELDTAICDLENRMRKWARVGVCGKEKWGQYQDEYFRMWDGGLYEIFFGYRCCRHGRFENFLWHVDHMLIPVSKTRFGWRYVGLSDFNTLIHLKQLVWKWQARMVNKAFQVTCAEHPDIVDELVSDVECYPMIKPCKWGNVDGEAIHNKYWKRV